VKQRADRRGSLTENYLRYCAKARERGETPLRFTAWLANRDDYEP
jgi:hypothetical protein